MITLHLLDRIGIKDAQATVKKCHYLHRPVDSRCSVEGYSVHLDMIAGIAGYLIFGRPEATRCCDWYGGVDDAQAGRVEVTRWQVLNLARVWISPALQPGGWADWL